MIIQNVFPKSICRRKYVSVFAEPSLISSIIKKKDIFKIPLYMEVKFHTIEIPLKGFKVPC